MMLPELFLFQKRLPGEADLKWRCRVAEDSALWRTIFLSRIRASLDNRRWTERILDDDRWRKSRTTWADR